MNHTDAAFRGLFTAGDHALLNYHRLEVRYRHGVLELSGRHVRGTGRRYEEYVVAFAGDPGAADGQRFAQVVLTFAQAALGLMPLGVFADWLEEHAVEVRHFESADLWDDYASEWALVLGVIRGLCETAEKGGPPA